MSDRETEVCVVGAGPAGLVVAHRLLSAGVPSVLVERLSVPELSQRAKAGMIEHRVAGALAPLGLDEPIRQRGGVNGTVEICVQGQRRTFDYSALTEGRGHYVFPQHLLVRAWADAWIRAGGQGMWSTEVVGVERLPGDAGARVVARAPSGDEVAIRCRALVLAAGAASPWVPPEIATHEYVHPFRWLTAMIAVPPLGERTIYAVHAHGFAAHLRRSSELTRFYLQIAAGDDPDAWDDARLRAELALRLGALDPARLIGETVERDVLDLRVRVREPLQSGNVFLAGDAAHLITPAGGKGMNLAILDAIELAEGLVERFSHGNGIRLSRYSDNRLPHIWRAQEFSNWMLSLFAGGVLNLHRGEPDPSLRFSAGLHAAQVERLFTDPIFARWFAHNYAGAEPR